MQTLAAATPSTTGTIPDPAGCPCCGGGKFEEVVGFRSVPATGVFRNSHDEPLSAADLYFEACIRCTLLRSRDFAHPPDYSDKQRTTGRQLGPYRSELMAAIGDLVGRGDELIIEIGSNDGTLLQLLQGAGYTNLVGVEPAVELVEASRRRGLRAEARYFEPEAVPGLIERYGQPRVAICRHTLEHVPYPGRFVSGIRDLLGPARGSTLVEVPDSTALFEGLNFVELWDEHLYYFTPRTLGLLLERHGLPVRYQKTYPHLDTRNLVACARVSGTGAAPATATPEACDWKAFAARFSRMAARLRDAITTAPRPVYLVGASHPQCNFVNFLELGPVVDFMIDDDPAKTGRVPPLRESAARIIATEEFVESPAGGSVVLTGFGYPAWMRRIADCASGKHMQVLYPRAFV